jgi:hypothetical protein
VHFVQTTGFYSLQIFVYQFVYQLAPNIPLLPPISLYIAYSYQ